ncbi:hypothetical protein MA16_Dca025476 [Dendrobium catenatum]|uniref:Uncharacterized protein n=1 Tax=Dendrobium catenatum TaxID=906689 RepID=A0A2I0WBY2_9ASPA|nr:hypothetical protein MA16_Dca025476 [Dendrobium catenatum]
MSVYWWLFIEIPTATIVGNYIGTARWLTGNRFFGQFDGRNAAGNNSIDSRWDRPPESYRGNKLPEKIHRQWLLTPFLSAAQLPLKSHWFISKLSVKPGKPQVELPVKIPIALEVKVGPVLGPANKIRTNTEEIHLVMLDISTTIVEKSFLESDVLGKEKEKHSNLYVSIDSMLQNTNLIQDKNSSDPHLTATIVNLVVNVDSKISVKEDCEEGEFIPFAGMESSKENQLNTGDKGESSFEHAWFTLSWLLGFNDVVSVLLDAGGANYRWWISFWGFFTMVNPEPYFKALDLLDGNSSMLHQLGFCRKTGLNVYDLVFPFWTLLQHRLRLYPGNFVIDIDGDNWLFGFCFSLNFVALSSIRFPRALEAFLAIWRLCALLHPDRSPVDLLPFSVCLARVTCSVLASWPLVFSSPHGKEYDFSIE